MSLPAAIAVYFVVWWLVLFAVLPWGVRTQEEEGEIAPGTNPSSPARPMLARKLAATSFIAAVILALVWWAHAAGLLDFSIPVPDKD